MITLVFLRAQKKFLEDRVIFSTNYYSTNDEHRGEESIYCTQNYFVLKKKENLKASIENKRIF